MRFQPATVAAATLAAALVFTAAPEPVAAQRHTLTGTDVAIYNLVGTMTVRGGGGSQVVVDVTPRGSDAARLQVEQGRVDGRDALRVRAPGNRILYPELGRGSRSNVQVARDGTFGDGARGTSVTIAGSGSGVQAWADLTVTVPAGRTVRLHAAVGSVEVSNVEGAVHIRTSSARSTATGVRGPLDVRASSGRIELTDIEGAVNARASSGSVRAENLRGSSHDIHTSSGSIQVRDVTGQTVEIRASSGAITAGDLTAARVTVQTASGSVTIDGASSDRVTARTSSGRLRATRIAAAELELQSSSGSVELTAVTPPRAIGITASSGSVRAALPADFGGSVDIRTGSGGISTEVPVQTTAARRNELVGQMGQGTSTLRIRTASGGVRITRT